MVNWSSPVSGWLIILGCLRCFVESTIIDVASTSIVVDGISYWTPPEPIVTISTPKKYNYGINGLAPFTVINTVDVSTSSLSSIVSDFISKDDVFSNSFLAGIYIKGSSFSTLKAPFSGPNVLLSKQVNINLPNGPYFVSNTNGLLKFYKAYRLYSDTQRGFLYGVIQTKDGAFSITSAAVEGYSMATIPVPSRLYYTATSKQPLAGQRIGVKDIYDVEGLKTGCGDLAYHSFISPANSSAPAVQRLIDAGAIIVGKTITSQFANGETSTADWVDQFCPFNPRGDGYQDPSSSSSGSGASMGAYDWLDYAIGSDTGGSIRGPAGAQGIYGIRPSHGAITLEGVMPLSSPLDTGGFFSRDPTRFNVFAKAWYGDTFEEFSQYPTKILNGIGNVSNPVAAAAISTFVDKLAAFTHASVTNVTLATLWESNGPVNTSISSYLNLTYPTLIGYEQLTTFIDPFNASYHAKFGKSPAFDPVPLVRWAFGLSQGADGNQEQLSRKDIFKGWFNSTVLTSEDKTCSNAIYLYAQSTGGTNYRNKYFLAGTAPFGFSNGRVSPLSEVPDIVVPVGQAPYTSTITNTIEHLPVTVSMLAAKGCDYMLMNLIEELGQAGILTSVRTGSTAF